METLGDGLHKTTCPMDCPDSCALEVEVENGRVSSIRGRRDHPDTAGFICSKVAKFTKRLEHPDRLLHPMRRVGEKGEGRFERISWDEAIAEMVDKFTEIRRQWGGEAIVPFHYGGSNGLLTDSLIDALFFERIGASRLELNICAAPTTAVAMGMYGKMPGVAFADYPQAECIVIWGANPKASNIHLAPYLYRAKQEGAFVATVDPRRNFSKTEIDLHLAVRPGTDLPVALAMIGLWNKRGNLDEAFLAQNATGVDILLSAAESWSVPRAAEVAGVEAADIERLAEVYQASHPAVIRCGWGLERNRNGGQAAAAVLAIPALLGKFGVRGGGYTMSNGRATEFDKQRLVGPTDGQHRRSLNMTQLGRWLCEPQDPQVKSLFIYNANPVATVPDQNRVVEGLRRTDLFTVVFDQVMTDSALYGDLVLPAVTFLEGYDLQPGYGSYVLGAVRPVIPVMGESRTNASVFSEIGRRLGFDDPAFRLTDEELLQEAVSAVDLNGKRPFAAALLQGQIAQHDFSNGDGKSVAGPIQLDTVVPRTPDGKIHLAPTTLGDRPYAFQVASEDWPLAMISPANSKMISSSFGEYNYPKLILDIHPHDAADRAIESGAEVRVFNELGEVHCTAKVNSRVRAGVVSMPKGAWVKSALNESTSTALCPDHLNVIGAGACFNDARVEVELLTPP